MPSVLIRNPVGHTHRRLKARAAANRRSLQEEPREMLHHGSFHPATEREHIADAALRLFGPEHGFDLDIPSRGSAQILNLIRSALMAKPERGRLDNLMSDPIVVYVFRSGCFARNGDSVVCVGPRPEIESLLGPGAVSRLFFGYALYRDEGGADLIGVWGRRNASRLRRLLREQGVELLVHRTPPLARLHSRVTTGVRQAPAKQLVGQGRSTAHSPS